MILNTRMTLIYVGVALLAAVPTLVGAAALSNATALATETSQDIPTPTCYSGGSAGSCSQFISDYCDQISQITFKPGDTEHHCYSKLLNKGATYKCVLGVRNTNANQAATPNAQTCKDTINTIARYCTYGGHGKNSAMYPFEFEIDNQNANSGICRNFANPP